MKLAHEGDPSPAAPKHNWTKYGLSSSAKGGTNSVMRKKLTFDAHNVYHVSQKTTFLDPMMLGEKVRGDPDCP